MERSSKKWWILTAMCLLTVVLNFDVSAINIAIPVIAPEFHATLTSMQWVINIYVLMSATLQIFGARLGDNYGHRKIFLIGTALFILSSLGASVSIDEYMLITFRFLQGVALGIAYPMTIVLTFAAFPKRQQGFALSFIVASMGISLAMGPPIGGLFVDYLSWRWIFYINIPIGILTLLLTWIFCEPHKETEKKYIDYKGTFFLLFGLVGVIIAINQLQSWGFSSYIFWSLLFGGLALLFILYFVCWKQEHPIIEFHLFKIRNFTLNNFLRLVSQTIFVPILFFTPLYLQNIAGISAIYSGLLMLFLTFIIAILSPFTGKWIDRIGDKLPNIISMLLFAVGCFLMVFLQYEPNYILLTTALFLVGSAVAIAYVSTVTGSVSVCPEKQHATATGLIFTIAWLGCALGVAVMGSILAMNSTSYLIERLPQETYTENQLMQIKRVAKGISSYKTLSQFFSKENISEISNLTRISFMNGFRISMLTFMWLSLTGAIFSLFLKKHKIPPHTELPNVF